VAVFFLVRLALLVVREPFIDELWTVWLARQPFSHILPALRVDSGPPLYYFLARFTDVFALRALSLLFSTATLALLLLRTSLGSSRWIAGALFAVYPPAVLYGVEARAYALCGLFVAAGVIALYEERPFTGAGALLLAAYTHWYGALFLPLVLLAKPRRRAFAALAAASVLFVPGLLLASRQPVEAIAWIRATSPINVLGALAFVRPYNPHLFAPPPLPLIVLAAAATLIAVARGSRFAPGVLVPVGLALSFAALGRNVYYALRFEAVLAVPLVLWIATSAERWQKPVRLALAGVLVACGLVTTVAGIAEHRSRPEIGYARAISALRQVLRPADQLVAIGHLYLYSVDAFGAKRVTAYPSEQAVHPGWRVRHATNEPLPPGPFVLIAEEAAPELRALRGRRVQVVYRNELAVMMRVAPR
jgi:hypothetical protein